MSDGCWVDLFSTLAPAGTRHRFYGPAVIDPLRYEPGETLTVRVGRGASVTLQFRDRVPRTLGPGEAIEAIDAASVEALHLFAAAIPAPAPQEERPTPPPAVRVSVAKRLSRANDSADESTEAPARDNAR